MLFFSRLRRIAIHENFIISSIFTLFFQVVFDRPAYHDQDTVYPVGFCSSCRYQSVVNPTTKCRYTSEVVDGGAKPIFRVTCEEDESGSIEGSSANVRPPYPPTPHPIPHRLSRLRSPTRRPPPPPSAALRRGISRARPGRNGPARRPPPARPIRDGGACGALPLPSPRPPAAARPSITRGAECRRERLSTVV